MDTETGHMLIVDDDENARDILSRRLVRRGYTTAQAGDGAEALEYIRAHPVDLVLLDVMMPGVNGLEALVALRRTHSMVELPVIMVTAKAQAEDVVGALGAGANDYVTKPVDFTVALARIRTQLSLKRAEEALREAKAGLEKQVEARTAELADTNSQLQGLVAHLPEGVCLLDVQSRVVLANPVAEDYLAVLSGVRTGGVISRIGDRPLAEVVTAGSDGQYQEIALEGTERRIFEVAACPVAARMADEKWVLVLREVTQERELEQKMRRQYHLASVGQLAAGIAHDFNNMLTVMIGFSQMLGMRDDIADDVKEDLGRIREQGERAAQLIRQILDFSRQTVAEQQPVDLVPFVKETVKLLGGTLPETIDVSTDLQGEALPVSGNLTQLQQVFTNLVVNARDAMPNGGRLEVGLSRILVASDGAGPAPDVGPGEWVLWTVADTGDGIPDDALGHIFEPFFTTKPRGEGTGLGLAQVYGITRQHGGSVDVESKVGEGTRFSVYLPLLACEEPAAEGEERTISTGDGRTVLLVEDQPDVRRVAKTMLETADYEVLTAENGRAAVDVYDRHADRISVVLTDMVMPVMGGLELFECLRERDPDVKLVLMSGYAQDAAARPDLMEQVSGLLEKPLVIGKVTDVISRALGDAQ